MTKLRCVHCGVSFIPAPQVPKQAYCSKINCQKERRRQWHKNKLQSDPDYKENQSRAQKAWSNRNPSYWKEHRKGKNDYENPAAAEQDLSNVEPAISSVKMDSLNLSPTLRKALQDGIYRLKVLAEPDGIKMDSWIVKLSSIHDAYRPISRRVKR